MTSPTSTPPGAPPESAGPGSYQPDGTVLFGDAAQAGAQAFVPPPVPAEQRERDRAEWAARSRCTRCSGLPDGLVDSLLKALADAKAGKIT